MGYHEGAAMDVGPVREQVCQCLVLTFVDDTLTHLRGHTVDMKHATLGRKPGAITMIVTRAPSKGMAQVHTFLLAETYGSLVLWITTSCPCSPNA
jgi:hypothetical protein